MAEQKVQSCDRRESNPSPFHGYSQRRSHPLYRTTNQTYGSNTPGAHLTQVQSRGTSRQFSETMLLSGMYRDHGFNTSMDRSRVTVSPGTQHKRTSLHHLCHHGNQSSGSDGNQ
ncbi:piercer of microtubule wall 1 protein [Amphiprion ocellaris]|uniref:piercer of microtubule wall 1 protein n=1 Tax=Amphiprion ocellaris TaxID=80972 RepID=UPI000C318D5D|nr:piercer of microtubule wall 1 protein [Amphiprion ocellaris]XP_023126748.1 piercer of microtubule wall 1 protein [Amphiprion ocellaris]